MKSNKDVAGCSPHILYDFDLDTTFQFKKKRGSRNGRERKQRETTTHLATSAAAAREAVVAALSLRTSAEFLAKPFAQHAAALILRRARTIVVAWLVQRAVVLHVLCACEARAVSTTWHCGGRGQRNARIPCGGGGGSGRLPCLRLKQRMHLGARLRLQRARDDTASRPPEDRCTFRQ